MSEEGVVVGIDLGTTYSVCAIVENGKPRVVSDTGGSYTIPSIVAVDDKGNRLIGQAAKRQSMINPLNTVYGSKRLVGRDIHSPVIDEIQEHFKYRIDEGEASDVLVKVRNENYALEEIQAMILDYIRNTSQDMLGKPISKAVVTVPAYFNDRQRQAVREAGKIAKLEVLRIINEPTAAALAYGFGKELHQKIAVFDLGGGTFDICILEVRNNVFEVKATGGNTFLGGVDFDNKIVEHVISEFKKEHNIDLAKDPMSHQRIKDAAEQAKIDLSTLPEARIHIPFITMGPSGALNIDIKVSREQFNQMIKPLIDGTIELLEKVMKESGFKKEELDALLLVGGSTRIPLVSKMVEDYLGKQPAKNVHPDEAVALGAAIMADALVNKSSDIMLLDVLPINIGIALPGDKVMPIFERNTSVPNQKLKVFTTSKDNQDSLKIKVVQGDEPSAQKCEPIGEFVFKGIHPAPKGKAKVEVVFTLNNEGILSVTAKDPDTGVEQTGQLHVSSTIQKTFRQDLIQPKQVAPKKEAQKVITRTVTREKKLKADTGAREAKPITDPKAKPAAKPATDPKAKTPAKPAAETPATPAAKPDSGPKPEKPAPASGVRAPAPAPTVKPGLLHRIKAFFFQKK